MLNYTLNKLKERLETFASDHKQVNDFVFDDPITAVNDNERSYLLVIADFAPSRLNKKDVELAVDVYFMDKVFEDRRNVFEVISDTFSVAMDFRAYMNNPDFNDDFVVMDSANLEKFEDRFNDVVTGWKMSLTLKMTDLFNRCQIPQ